MIIKCAFKIEGRITIKHFRNGVLYRTDTQKNLIVNAGLQMIRDLLKGKGCSPSHIAVGTGDVEPLVGDTILTAEIDPDGLPVKEAEDDFVFRNDGRNQDLIEKSIIGNFTVRFQRILPQGSSNLNKKDIAEAGLFNRYRGGDMLAKVKLTSPFTKDELDQQEISWEITISRDGDFGGNNSIVDSGLNVVRDILLQADADIPNSLHLPFYITHIIVGDNSGGVVSTQTGLINELPTEFNTSLIQTKNGRRRVSRFDATFSGDIDFDPAAPKLFIQREIPTTQFPSDTLREAGLFSVREVLRVSKEFEPTFNKVDRQVMFSRVVLDPVSPATQNTLSFEITIKRG